MSPPQVHLVISLEGDVRAETWVFTTHEEARLLADLLGRDRRQLHAQLDDALDRAIEYMARNVSSYAPCDLMPPAMPPK